MQNSPSINYQSYQIELYWIDNKWLSARYFNHIFWSCQCNVIVLINSCLSNYVFGVALYILPMLYAYDSDYCVWLDLPEVLVIDNPLTLFPAKNILQ